jgi:hypothetical protein
MYRYDLGISPQDLSHRRIKENRNPLFYWVTGCINNGGPGQIEIPWNNSQNNQIWHLAEYTLAGVEAWRPSVSRHRPTHRN